MQRAIRFLTWMSASAVLGIVGCEPPPQEQAPSVPSAPSVTASAEPGKADPDAATEFTVTPSGLKYKILRSRDGKHPGPTANVVAHYRGWLDDGTEFDSSYKRGEPTPFPLDGVIKGWTEGLQLIGEGGMIELEIPADLAYGADGRPGIPPNATLHFIVELIKVR